MTGASLPVEPPPQAVLHRHPPHSPRPTLLLPQAEVCTATCAWLHAHSPACQYGSSSGSVTHDLSLSVTHDLSHSRPVPAWSIAKPALQCRVQRAAWCLLPASQHFNAYRQVPWILHAAAALSRVSHTRARHPGIASTCWQPASQPAESVPCSSVRLGPCTTAGPSLCAALPAGG